MRSLVHALSVLGSFSYHLRLAVTLAPWLYLCVSVPLVASLCVGLHFNVTVYSTTHVLELDGGLKRLCAGAGW